MIEIELSICLVDLCQKCFKNVRLNSLATSKIVIYVFNKFNEFCIPGESTPVNPNNPIYLL